MVAGFGGPESGSRWSARSGARTNDLDAGEDRRIIEHHELQQPSGHRVLLQVVGDVDECGRSGLAWVLEPAVRFGDMTIDRVTLRVRDRVDLLRPSSATLASGATSGAGRAGPLPSADLPGHVCDISGRLG